MADTTRTIRIKIDSRNAVKKVDQLDNKMGGLSTNISKVAAAVAVAFAVRPLIKYSDEFKNLQNQLRLVTKGTKNLADVTQELFEVSQRSRTNLSATGDLYTKLARSTEELGISQRELIRITETINKSFAVSGATAQEAENAIKQLGQGLSAGALRGDEFNSVAEQAPGILRAVAAETGKTVGELREFAAEGKITTELLVSALQNYAGVVDGEFNQANITISQSTTLVENSFIRLVGVFDDVLSAGSGVSSVLVDISNAIDSLSDGVASGAVGEVFSSQFDIISRETSTALDGIRGFYDSILREAGITSEGVDGAMKYAFSAYLPTVVAAVKATILTLKTLTDFVDLTAKQIRELMTFDGLGDDLVDAIDFTPLENSLGFVSDAFKNVFDTVTEYYESTGLFDNIKSGVESVGTAVAETDLAQGVSSALGEYQGLTAEYQKQLDLILATREADIEKTNSAIENAQRLMESFRSDDGGTITAPTPEGGPQGEEILAPFGEMPLDQQFEFFNAKHELLNNDLMFWQMYNQGRVNIMQLAANQEIDIEKEKRDAQLLTSKAYLSTAQTIVGVLANLAGGSKKASKVLRLVQGSMSAYQIYASSEAAAFQILATPPGPILNPALIPAAAAMSLKGKVAAGAVLAASTASAFSSGGGGGPGSVSVPSASSTASAAPTAPTAPVSDQVQTLDTGALINELRGLGSEPIPASFAARILEAIPEARQITGEG